MSSTPEHDKRKIGSLFDEVNRAYDYVVSVEATADEYRGLAPLWHGWALREAFLAGISYERSKYA